jgi:crotonobetainyl-CoA:carnitine CoA-transferase CaiB-like acyl-CoA transferase
MRTRDEWVQIFGEYDLFCSGVNSVMELPDDPQVIENGYLVDFEHPTVGKIKIPGYPVHFSEARAQTTCAAPALGEHTEEVLTGLGEYTQEEIAQLRKEGVI